MQGEWVNIQVSRYFTETERNVRARAFYSTQVIPDLEAAESGYMGLIQMADFIYALDDQRVLKNRHGSIETLYEDAGRYMHLKHHKNESVRRLIEKAETLAALTNT